MAAPRVIDIYSLVSENCETRSDGHRIKMCRIEPAPSTAPEWYNSDMRCTLPIAGISESRAEGRVLLGAIEQNKKIPLVTESKNGRRIFHFDPVATFEHITQEQYRPVRRPLMSRLPFHYHIVPGRLRAPIARAATIISWHSQNLSVKNNFPSFPVEPALELLLHVIENDSLEKTENKFHVMLTHDVDEPDSFAGVEDLRTIEQEMGFKSVWFFTGRLFDKFEKRVSELKERGNEIGLHGTRHDLKFAHLPKRDMRARLDSVADFIQRWDIRGFRSPYYQRTPRMLHVLSEYFKYDSSVPDTDIFTPGMSPGGCGMIRPFPAGGIVELPVSLPFEIPFLAGKPAARLLPFWRGKIDFIQKAGGVPVVNTHPDAHVSGRADMQWAYRKLLEDLHNRGARVLLPGDIF